MQLLYWSTRDTQSAAGFLAVEKSMHSSRFAFSSLHTQQGCVDISTGSSSMPKVRKTDLGLGSTLGLCGRRNRRRGQGYIFHMTISFAQKRNWKRIDVQKVAGLASMVFVGRSAKWNVVCGGFYNSEACFILFQFYLLSLFEGWRWTLKWVTPDSHLHF